MQMAVQITICSYCQVKMCSTATAKSVQTAVGGRGIESSSPRRYLPTTVYHNKLTVGD